MTKFHLRFRDFKPETVEATDELFAAKPWRLETDDEKLALAQAWLDKVCPVYEIPKVRLFIGRDEARLRSPSRPATQSGDPLAYVPSEDDEEDAPDVDDIMDRPTLKIEKWSLIQLFKAFRSYMLDNNITRNRRHSRKDDIFGWACSLFYTVRPVMFRARVREGRIKRIRPQELLATRTREQIEEAQRAIVQADIESNRDATFEDVGDLEQADEERQAEADNVARFDGLDALNRDAIRALAATAQIPGRGSMNKDQLVAELRARGVRVGAQQSELGTGAPQ